MFPLWSTKTTEMKIYPSDLTDSQWKIIEKQLPAWQRGRKISLRSVFNALLYLNKAGCQWRMLPREYPKWQTVYYYFRVWKDMGVMEDLSQFCTEQSRMRKGRQPSPSLGIVDAQSVKTSFQGGFRGYDGNKRLVGRKRHIVVDTNGWIMGVLVQSAHHHENRLFELMCHELNNNFPRLEKIIADTGYRGSFANEQAQKHGWELQIVPRSENKQFNVVPKRWIVERTFAWLGGYRRLSKDFERLLDSSRSLIHLANIATTINIFPN